MLPVSAKERSSEGSVSGIQLGRGGNPHPRMTLCTLSHVISVFDTVLVASFKITLLKQSSG